MCPNQKIKSESEIYLSLRGDMCLNQYLFFGLMIDFSFSYMLLI